jgi:hypothetical protein
LKSISRYFRLWPPPRATRGQLACCCGQPTDLPWSALVGSAV